MAASEAKAHGPSGVVLVARATGISEDTIRREIVELESGERLAPRRVRRSGSGRKPLTETAILRWWRISRRWWTR